MKTIKQQLHFIYIQNQNVQESAKFHKPNISNEKLHMILLIITIKPTIEMVTGAGRGGAGGEEEREKAYPASKRSGVPDHLALRATCTFLGMRFSAETECPERQMQKSMRIINQNPDRTRSPILESLINFRLK